MTIMLSYLQSEARFYIALQAISEDVSHDAGALFRQSSIE